MAARSFAPGFQRMNASSTRITNLAEVEQLGTLLRLSLLRSSQVTVMIATRSAVCRNRKFLGDRAIELLVSRGNQCRLR